jgi:hypothetical protein
MDQSAGLARSVTNDPQAITGWIEIPQCSGLLPRRGVLSFRRSKQGQGLASIQNDSGLTQGLSGLPAAG